MKVIIREQGKKTQQRSGNLPCANRRRPYARTHQIMRIPRRVVQHDRRTSGCRSECTAAVVRQLLRWQKARPPAWEGAWGSESWRSRATCSFPSSRRHQSTMNMRTCNTAAKKHMASINCHCAHLKTHQHLRSPSQHSLLRKQQMIRASHGPDVAGPQCDF